MDLGVRGSPHGRRFSFERKVRLGTLAADRHLAVSYGERGTKGRRRRELVDLKQDAKKGALVRSLFRLKPVRDHEASSGFACLITHDVRPKNRDGERTTLYLKASEPKKDRSRRIVFEDNSTVSPRGFARRDGRGPHRDRPRGVDPASLESGAHGGRGTHGVRAARRSRRGERGRLCC